MTAPQEVSTLDAKVYEVLSLAMRYFFAFFGVMIVWRAFSWLRKDRRLKHKRLKQLPDAGTIGILTVQRGSRQFQPGMVIPVPHEGVLGYLRTCDVVVPVDDVASAHLDFTFVDGKGLYLYPRRGCEATVDGVALTSRRVCRQYPMQHGSVLEVGQAVLQLGVFAGLNVLEAHPASATIPEIPDMGAFMPAQPEQFAPRQPWPTQNYACPPDSAWQQGSWAQPGAPANPPVQPPYAPPMTPPAPPFGPAYPQQTPWQGGDGNDQ